MVKKEKVKLKPQQAEEAAPFFAGIAEFNRRESGNFDGLFGQLPSDASVLLRDLLSYLRDYLLDKYSESQIRSLLLSREPRDGYHNLPPVPDDVALAIDLLNSFRGAAQYEGEKFADLILGRAGARDAKRQAGTQKKRLPQINSWIDIELARNSDAKSPNLWLKAPDEITDLISYRSFERRVTECRKSRASN